nr:unnamed protein product [Naegleria fowleri]
MPTRRSKQQQQPEEEIILDPHSSSPSSEGVEQEEGDSHRNHIIQNNESSAITSEEKSAVDEDEYQVENDENKNENMGKKDSDQHQQQQTENNTVNSNESNINIILHQQERTPTQNLEYSENYNTLLEDSTTTQNNGHSKELTTECVAHTHMQQSNDNNHSGNEKFNSTRKITPEYEELDIQEEEEDHSSKRKISITINNTKSGLNDDNATTVVTLQQVDLSQNDDANNSSGIVRTEAATSTTTIEINEPLEKESFLKSLWTSKQKWQHFVEKIIINHKSKIEFLKALGNLMYLGSRSRTDVDLTEPASEEAEKENHLLDILETEKISTVITTIGWYQDYVADKHKLQHKNIQSDERFMYYHKVGQFLRLIECFILLVEIIFKTEYKSKKTGRRNYWNVIIITEIIRAVLKLVAIFKSKTNVPMFLNYTVLPPDEETMNIPMANLLPVAPKIHPFEKEKQALEEYKEKQRTQAKPRIGSRSGRKIPSSDEMFAVLSNSKTSSHSVPTTTELGKQLGHASQHVYILLAGYDRAMDGTRGKMLLYLSEVIYACKPVVYSFLLAKYGFRSWTPFVVSLLMELFSLYVSKKAVSIIEGEQRERVTTERPATSGMVIESEYNRRVSSLFNYLYRGPLFELIMNRVFKLILLPILKRIPLLGGSLVGYIEYIIMVQQFYFFCNPSV